MVGIETEIQLNKSWVVKGVAQLPFFQLVSNGVKFRSWVTFQLNVNSSGLHLTFARDPGPVAICHQLLRGV